MCAASFRFESNAARPCYEYYFLIFFFLFKIMYIRTPGPGVLDKIVLYA